MTNNTIPTQSYLAEPVVIQNFAAYQSAQLAVSGGSTPITFTAPPGTTRATLKITNKGTSGAYVAVSPTGSATAVVSTSTPAANCDYIAQNTVQVQDYVGGAQLTVAAIQDTGATTLEISVGYGS